MIEAVIKQDIDELNEHIESLFKKYDRDFHFFGQFGINTDENDDESIDTIGSFVIVGESYDIHKGLHHMLEKEAGVEFIMDALRCHCRCRLPRPTKFTADLRDKVLNLLQTELEKIAREDEAKEEVDKFLDHIGFNH